MQDLSEIVEECQNAEITPERSLEAENAYAGEADFEPTEEQNATMERIIEKLDNGDY